ncbi:HD domain-containing phosphohydrolase [Dechloromonas sp. ZS-1]|uniref:HD-GYP domain-containing protein n=1 Tax=Dechloromonas sp. ZS-1 TaxID=3138067 RepID=UPI0031FBB79D
MSAPLEIQHHDLLDALNKKTSVSDKIAFLHRVVRQHCAFIHRIGVAVYDQRTDTLKTFAHSTEGENPLGNYQCKLREARALYQIFLDGQPRVVNDIAAMPSAREHTRRLQAFGFRASYTIPTYLDDSLTGFVFFNSRFPDVFDESSLPYFDMIARLISLLVSVELQQVRTLYGALKMATSFSGHKDPETGEHLDRMAHFSRLIANEVAPHYGLSDEFVESIYWFAPMHDVGKIAIPDHIIRKPAKLSTDEFEVMKTHATRGREIINSMLGNFNLDRSGMARMIGNIAEYHHENMDGSGYPCGLRGDDIPIEARIVAVADVFDALTSTRCYKPAWSNEEAFEALRGMAAWKLDRLCVDALCRHAGKVQEIQDLFQDSHEPPERDAFVLRRGCGAAAPSASVLDSVR